MSARRRATVVIRQRDSEADDGYYREWCHKADLEIDEFGVTLHWDEAKCETYVPWPSIVRIDVEPCRCFDCERVAA